MIEHVQSFEDIKRTLEGLSKADDNNPLRKSKMNYGDVISLSEKFNMAYQQIANIETTDPTSEDIFMVSNAPLNKLIDQLSPKDAVELDQITANLEEIMKQIDALTALLRPRH